jgi:hypothetical protein
MKRAIIDAKYPVLRRAGGASAHPSRSPVMRMRQGEPGETEMPPVPGPNVPSAESVSDGRTPSMRLLDPTVGTRFSVGIIARKYSRMLTIFARTKP